MELKIVAPGMGEERKLCGQTVCREMITGFWSLYTCYSEILVYGPRLLILRYEEQEQ